MSGRFQRNSSVEAAPLQQELMLFNASTKKFCVLNVSAARMWERLDEPRTAEELVDSLCEEFSAAGRGPVEEDVKAFLSEMESLDLVSRAT